MQISVLTILITLYYTTLLPLPPTTTAEQALTDRISSLGAEEAAILQRQAFLKKELYGRFGDSINLES